MNKVKHYEKDLKNAEISSKTDSSQADLSPELQAVLH